MKNNENTLNQPLACIILAAGQGTRMKSSLPKVMHKIAGLPMIQHVIHASQAAGADTIIPVIAPHMNDVRSAVTPHDCATQIIARGTADAVKAAKNALSSFTGHILVLFGDTPLLKAESLRRMLAKQNETHANIVVNGFTPDDAGTYGRLIIDTNGELEAIIEAADATPEQLAIKNCNGGIMLFESQTLWELLDEIKNDNSKNEYYLTDCIAIGRSKGKKIVVAELDVEDTMGINNRLQLAESEKQLQKNLRNAAMKAGVTMQDPNTVFLCPDTKLGRDVVIEPNVFFGPNVTISDNVTIRAFSHIEGSTVKEGATIGPFARLRPGTEIGQNARIGNFVEVKNTKLEEGAKVNHLSYIGDARIGKNSNIGAGTITCNYDGFNKSKTDIGEGAFIGSNSALVAPISIGDGALIAAGSTITKNVPAQAIAIARVEQKNRKELATRLREKQKAIKEKNGR